jgi:predicted AlkP superfamily phosphohydrolase/phosphomutase
VAQGHPGINVALYLGGWDTANHALWRYSRVDAAASAAVLERYLIFIDRNIQQLLAVFASAPNVVIVSDHGFSEGWHDERAMFLASGPGVPFREGIQTMNYFDVVPTLLDLQGLAAPPSLTGRSIVLK